MFKFKKGLRKDFKTEAEFLKDVYYRNIGVIPSGTTADMFVNQVRAYKIANDTNITGALNKLANTEIYTPYTERAGDNIVGVLEKHGQLKKFKTMLRDSQGRFVKYNRSKLRWDHDAQVYIYDNKISINVRNSPEQVIIKRI